MSAKFYMQARYPYKGRLHADGKGQMV